MYLADPPYPACGHRGMRVGKKLALLGPAHVAGVFVKLSTTGFPCSSSGFWPPMVLAEASTRCTPSRSRGKPAAARSRL